MATRGIFWTDLETGGRSNVENPILQIATAITTPPPDFRIIAYWMNFVKPNKLLKVEQEALDVNHLDLDFLERHGAEETDVMQTLQAIVYQFPMQLVFGGFYAGFDLGFVEAMERRTLLRLPLLRPPEEPIFDVYKIAKGHLPPSKMPLNEKTGKPSYSLVSVRSKYDLGEGAAHDAGWDIYDTIRLARYMYKEGARAA